MFSKVLKGAYGPGKDTTPEEEDTGRGITPPCQTCKWRNNDNPVLCKAFPNGIPIIILMGGHNHRTYYDVDGVSDHGIVYEPLLAEPPTVPTLQI
jgi:hypothetical protein